MNRLQLTLTHPLVKLGRLHHRAGYGVHSPFAYEYITRVILEHTPYYIYRDLAHQQTLQAPLHPTDWARREPRRVKQLLMRITNRQQTQQIIDLGATSSAAIYLQAGHRSANYQHPQDLHQLQLILDNLNPINPDQPSAITTQPSAITTQPSATTTQPPEPQATPPLTLLYLHDHHQPHLMQQAFDTFAPRAQAEDLILVEGIGYTPPMRQLWQTIRQHPRTVITFDLHDLGIVYLNPRLHPHHYTVCF